ncbi:MAG TPA: hypothetical protein PLW44_03850 [Chitinophagales bacterium]|nr:hypothetical protein [Chitinophagales bacterium]
MKYNNRLFPHPVLGIDDDINAEFTGELTYSSNKDNISLEIVFKLTDDQLTRYIQVKKIMFVIHVYCRGTMYRNVFVANSTLPDPILIPAMQLKGDVEVDFFIAAVKQIDGYSSSSFHQDYKGYSFSIENADILAYGGKGKFIANKSPEELKSISSLIRVKNSGKNNQPMYNEYDGKKIEINLCEQDFERYQLAIRNKEWVNVIHSSIVLPALIDALYFLEKPESKDCCERRWYSALLDIKSKSKRTKDCFQLAQEILEHPNNRTLETIVRELE